VTNTICPSASTVEVVNWLALGPIDIGKSGATATLVAPAGLERPESDEDAVDADVELGVDNTLELMIASEVDDTVGARTVAMELPWHAADASIVVVEELRRAAQSSMTRALTVIATRAMAASAPPPMTNADAATKTASLGMNSQPLPSTRGFIASDPLTSTNEPRTLRPRALKTGLFIKI
jgi:hypothetical protein